MAIPFLALDSQFTSSVDASVDSIPFWHGSTNSAFWVNRNTFLNLASQPVGITDSQTLTNKTLTSPTISGPTFSGTILGTYTIGGIPTFPSAVVTLTGSQTLINKVLTAPTITGGSLDNATVSVDAISGHTTANAGTVYGMSVTSGVLASAALLNTVNTAALQTNAVGASNISATALVLGYAQITTNFTTTSTSFVQVTGLTSTVTIPAGSRHTRVTAYIGSLAASSSGVPVLSLWDGTVGSGTQLQQSNGIAGDGHSNYLSWVGTPAVGPKTYNLGADTTTGTLTITAGSTLPAYILVEAL
jgi:hypothetical protein